MIKKVKNNLKSARCAMNRRTGYRAGERGGRGAGKRNRRFPQGRNRTRTQSHIREHRRARERNLETCFLCKNTSDRQREKPEKKQIFQNFTCLKASSEREPKLARFWLDRAWATDGADPIEDSDWLIVELEFEAPFSFSDCDIFAIWVRELRAERPKSGKKFGLDGETAVSEKEAVFEVS